MTQHPITRGMLESHGLTPDAADYVMRQVEAVRAELERTQKQAAAMAAALRKAHEALHSDSDEIWREALCAINSAAQDDAGAGYVSKDQVRPLCDALSCASGFIAMTVKKMGADTSVTHEKVKSALAHARTLGL
jgi:hypothetical protein